MNENQFNIILVEDNSVLREEIQFQLGVQQIPITAVPDGVALNKHLKENTYQIAILDIKLPGENGFSIAKRLRKTYPEMWIILLTAQDSIESRLDGFDCGADLYIVKPVDCRELVAQINAFKRRYQSDKIKSFAQWKLTNFAQFLTRQQDEVKIKLTHMEGQALSMLAAKQGEIVSRQQLIEHLEPEKPYTFDPHRLESCISRLRQKILKAYPNNFSELEQSELLPLKTVRGQGYVFTESISIE